MEASNIISISSYTAYDLRSRINELDVRLEAAVGKKALAFIRSNVDTSQPTTKVLETASRFNVNAIKHHEITDFVNIKPVNEIRYINKFFIAVNNKLDHNGRFLGCVETYEQRRARLLDGKPKILGAPFLLADFIYRRALPKLNLTKELYFWFTKGRDRVLSKTETLGRLVACGFTIEKTEEIDGLLYFVANKTGTPRYPRRSSSGFLFKMKRIGKNGEIITVFKFRTMHAYSEYLQQYIFEQNNLKKGGKIRDDFRITPWGKVMRKLWIDELPMILNWLKGDLKLVGIRPLSQHFLSLYREDLKRLRLKHKPGLLPPFYADLPKTLPEIMDSEERYLKSYEQRPLLTDTRYFFKLVFNILFRGARSS